MQSLRNTHQLARLILAWFVLSLGVAIASPMVKPQGMQLICSGAGVMKVVVAGDDGKAPGSSHTLDCPLCAGLGAPPPLTVSLAAEAPSLAYAMPGALAAPHLSVQAAPLPARGPPAAL